MSVKNFVSILERLCFLLRCDRISLRIKELRSENVEISEEILESLYNDLCDMLSKRLPMMIEFHDQDKRSIRRDKIITYQVSYNIEGFPTIILNKYDSGLNVINNPLEELELVYFTEKDRDEDVSMLRFYLN